MRIQLIILTMILSTSAIAVDDKSMQDLFNKYDSVMDHKKTEFIDDVFTDKFIKESGGKKELIEKISELPTPKDKSVTKSKFSWKKGQKGEVYLAKVKASSDDKSKDQHEAEFVIVKENGKLKIDGTMSDAE